MDASCRRVGISYNPSFGILTVPELLECTLCLAKDTQHI